MLGVVSPLDLFTAIKAKVNAQPGFLNEIAVHYGRRPPNAVLRSGAQTPYMLVMIEEQDGADVESDGAVAQVFDVEMAIRTVGPTDATLATTALVALDPRWYRPGGVDLGDTDKAVVGILPKSGKLRLIEPLEDGGQDQYFATRRWEVHCAALIGV